MKTQGEINLKNRLKYLHKQRKVIYMSLWPTPKGNRTIVKAPVNECRLNEGRLGVFTDISEDFYDKMVNKYHNKIKRL